WRRRRKRRRGRNSQTALPLQLAHAPAEKVGHISRRRGRQSARSGAELDEFCPHHGQVGVKPPVIAGAGGAFLEALVDIFQAALERLLFFLEDRAQLLANLEGLLLERLVDMGQFDFHLQYDIHQPFNGLAAHRSTLLPFSAAGPWIAIAARKKFPRSPTFL